MQMALAEAEAAAAQAAALAKHVVHNNTCHISSLSPRMWQTAIIGLVETHKGLLTKAGQI